PSAALRKEIKRADQIAAYFEATLLAGFSTAEATEFFGRPRGFNADRFDFTPRSVTWAQNAFLKRFSAIETSRHQVSATAIG
ncbi:hydrolase, partial [Mesorhizobium sp. M7A.F.Ca.CA.004.01.1.1]